VLDAIAEHVDDAALADLALQARQELLIRRLPQRGVAWRGPAGQGTASGGGLRAAQLRAARLATLVA